MPESDGRDAQKAVESRRTQKLVAGIGGGAVVLVGIIAIPYPGPGWLIVFAGLAILAREFPWAGRLLVRLRARYDAFQAWVLRQGRPAQLALFVGTTVVVVLTLWFINAYGILVGILGLDWPWASSPFFWGK